METTKATFKEFMADPANIEAAKEKYAVVKQVDAQLKDGTIESFIIAQPTRTVTDILSKYLSENKDQKARDVLNQNCILAGNMELITDPKNTVAAESIYGQITDLLEKLQVTAKEL